MKYYLEIDTNNDAFHQNGPATELVRILQEVALRMDLEILPYVADFSFQHEEAEFPIKDSNGNKVGVHGYKEGPFND
jgi:hypothetical protein